MKQTAVEWLFNNLNITGGSDDMKAFEQAKAMEKEQIILLVERLMEYTKESQIVLGNDEREASEFVDIFYNETFKSK